MTLAIAGLKLITPRRFTDARGYFVESWNRSAIKAQGLDIDFCQDNQSLSLNTFTIRGLHFQKPPHAQAKLVSVSQGRIFDVAVDLRRSSPTFGRHVAVELDAATGAQLFIPAGFAHGFCTLEPATLVHYKVDAPYGRSRGETSVRGAPPEFNEKRPFSALRIERVPREAPAAYLRDRRANCTAAPACGTRSR